MAKIQDEREVFRWFEEGRTYAWMSEQYMSKYNLVMTPSAWGNFRRRHGIERRISRNDDLIPWEVRFEHRWAHDIRMLRYEVRHRAGMDLPDRVEDQLAGWKGTLDRDEVVVHYDPDTEQGWFHVPRREGVDLDLIREPPRKTTQRKAAD